MSTNKWENLGENLYRRGGSIYHRSQVGGKRNWVKLKATTLRNSKQELAGIIRQTTCQGELFIGRILSFYLEHDCPKRNEKPRGGRQLQMEVKRVETLRKKLSKVSALSINHGTLRSYREWRGHTRACELDIITLACAFRWAYRNPDQTGLTTNPMPMDRPKFAPVQKHCRERQPSNAAQLHTLASTLMQERRSAIFGWMTLFLAFTGLRLERARMLRLDSVDHGPGHHDGECIWVGTSQTHKGVFPFIKLHDALRQWWNAFMEWRAENHISSPYYFPSPRNPASPVGAQSLEHAMRRVCAQLEIPKRSPHGLRSYYVNVLRSRGIMDAEIALRIGHRSGGRLIVEVYGEITPHPISFMPEGEPAWIVTTSVTTFTQ